MRRVWVLVGAVAFAAAPRAAQAQGLSITPQVGVYIPGDDFERLRAGADSVWVEKEGAFALGVNATFGILRGSLAYASGATLRRTRVSGDVGDGKLLAAAADVVLRPLPRLIVQPYLLLGAGVRREDYSYDEDGFDAFPRDDTRFALHAGVGADVHLGPVGISAEVTDFISRNQDDDWKRHDAFAFVGLKLRL